MSPRTIVSTCIILLVIAWGVGLCMYLISPYDTLRGVDAVTNDERPLARITSVPSYTHTSQERGGATLG
jgi:hypothetical protein